MDSGFGSLNTPDMNHESQSEKFLNSNEPNLPPVVSYAPNELIYTKSVTNKIDYSTYLSEGKDSVQKTDSYTKTTETLDKLISEAHDGKNSSHFYSIEDYRFCNFLLNLTFFVLFFR